MKKLPLILGMVAGGIALFTLSIFIILAAQGKLNNETLTRLPIVGGFFGRAVHTVVIDPMKAVKEKEAEEVAKKKAPEEMPAPLTEFNIPSPFNAKELNELSIQLEEAKKHYEEGLAEVTLQKETLARKEKDIEQRWEELNAFAGKLEDLKKKLDDGFKQVQQKSAGTEADEQANIKTITDWYRSIENAQTIATQLEKMGAEKTMKILEEMSKDDDGKEKAGSILASLNPAFAMEVTSLTLKRRK